MIQHVETTNGLAPEGISSELMEVIKKASIQYTYTHGGPNCIAGDYFNQEFVQSFNRNPVFEDGVIWAIQNLDKLKIKQ